MTTLTFDLFLHDKHDMCSGVFIMATNVTQTQTRSKTFSSSYIWFEGLTNSIFFYPTYQRLECYDILLIFFHDY